MPLSRFGTYQRPQDEQPRWPPAATTVSFSRERGRKTMQATHRGGEGRWRQEAEKTEVAGGRGQTEGAVELEPQLLLNTGKKASSLQHDAAEKGYAYP